MQTVQVRLKAQHEEYEIRIGRGLRSQVGGLVRSSLGIQTARIAVVSNQKVFKLYGSQVLRSLRDDGFSVSHMLMADGERYKTFRTATQVVDFLANGGLERSDAVMALGGGVVGDVAGFAAAVYLRGVPLVQVPTTLLAQIDSSVGGKTGVNLPMGKNLMGTFHQPNTVVIDTETLSTLPSREVVSGLCETVKQAVVGSRRLFEQTTGFLTDFDTTRNAFGSPELEKLVAAHCAFKASIVASDALEDTGRSDRRSRRILNFGHTTAHALEAVTNYKHFRHGEAVGYGMLVAGEISKNLGLLGTSELESLREAVRMCGRLPAAGELDETTIMNSLARDKKKVGGRIKWVLLEQIGRPRIVDGGEISPRLLRLSLRAGLRNR